MSSRAFRRLQEQKLENKIADNLSEEEESPEIIVEKQKKKTRSGNLFDVLAVHDAVVDNDAEIDGQENISDEGTPAANDDQQSSIKVSKKKKKKKKRKKEKSKNNTETQDGGGLDELDEVDRSVKEVNEMLGITDTTGYATVSPLSEEIPVFRSKSILTVDPRNLNPENEMKKRFGASVVQNAGRRRNPHDRHFKMGTSMVAPRANWPPFTKAGISMNPVDSDKHKFLFTFEHQESYRKVQFMFFDAVESIDHNNIVALLNNHPYHIDSMLQLSEICKISEDLQMAAELIERALYVFECSFHTLFNITQGTCRLQYKRSENRPFYLALFRHIHYLGDKACYRTALEFCKVLLGLDPSEDPLCVLLMLDYYALKAEEYKYFIQLTDEYEYSRNVSLLPNFAYSYALAKFHCGLLDEANIALRKALISFPSLVVELMDKNGISLDDVIKTNKYFDPVTYLAQSSSLNQLISLYVGRCHVLWKPVEVLNWFTDNCKYVIDNMDTFKDEMNAVVDRNKTRYKVSPRNVLRHIIISDVKEAARHLPVDVRNQTVMQYDPLPPTDSETGYERPTRPNSRQESRNLVSLFLQSLMPSYNQEGDPRGQQNRLNELHDQARAIEDDDQQDRAGLNALQGGAQQLMNAMRELLNTMTYRNDAMPPDEDENEEFNQDEWLD